MATIPNLAPQPQEQPEPEQPQPFQPSLQADVQDGGTEFRMRTTPFEIRVMPVPDELMLQVVIKWLQIHPEAAMQIMRQVKESLRNEGDIKRVIQASQHR